MQEQQEAPRRKPLWNPLWNRQSRKRLKGRRRGRGSIPGRGALLWILMFSRLMAATRHLHAGSAPGAACDGREHKAPGARRPWPRRRAASAGGVSEPVPAQGLGAGRGRSSDVGAAAVKDLKTRHATAAPRRAPRPSYAGAGLAQAPPAPPRAPRAPPPDGDPALAPPPARGLAVPQPPVLRSPPRVPAPLCRLGSVGQPG